MERKTIKARKVGLTATLAKLPKPKKRGRPPKSKSVKGGKKNDGKQESSE